ncbi:hypothetical protein [Plantibacter sp. YIM 135249]|uniref:hypothetical protein n=1 Tax=Plantibacter sp. YIM 135249 TaxID=3423918 RepID=UPI003D34918E
MTISLRGTLDPAPDKRLKSTPMVEVSLFDRVLATTVEGVLIGVSLGRIGEALAGASVGAPGLITVEATVADASEIDRAAEAMLVAATRLSDAIRSGYPAAGLVGQRPAFVSFEKRIKDGAWVGLNHWPPAEATIIYQPVTSAAAQLALENGIGLTERLLGQAKFWAQHAESNDAETAVLLAAIAVESHAKSVLTSSLTQRGDAKLAAVLFGKPSPSTSSAADLYDKVAMSILDRSYKLDHLAHYRKLAKLFESRNQVAHTGRLAVESYAEARHLARVHVHIAGMATRWLSAVSSE